MNGDLVLTNASVVTGDNRFDGTVVVRDGRVAEVSAGRSAVSGAVDLEGDDLLPGLIEMHTDNLERHMEPRPGVVWPSALAAVVGHDTQIVGAGITTVFDAVSVGEYVEESNRNHIMAESVAAVRHARADGLLRADHLLHMRCEVTDACVVELFEPYADDPLVRLVSVMDHTPGQRQWRDPEHYFSFYANKFSRAELEERLLLKKARQQRHAAAHRRAIVAMCRDRRIPLASHDDATEEHVCRSAEDGMAIAEFPITHTAAVLSRANGMGTIMGAPNVVRGGSHSGNMSALEVAAEGLLDGLSSDYVPASLLHAAYLLNDRLDMPLPEAVAKVSGNVARLVGLDDRGEIAPGKKADLIRVRLSDGVPVVRRAWRDGRVVS